MVAAWPAAMNPSMLVSFISETTSMAAGTYLWDERTEKFSGTPARSTAAVATAVVSKPLAKKTTCSAGRARAISTAWDRVDHLDLAAVGLGVGERLHRPGQPQHVTVGADAGPLRGERHRLVHLGGVGHAHRAAGPHDDVELAGEARRGARSGRWPARGSRRRA